MNKTNKIQITGHRDMLCLAVWSALESKGYSHIIRKTRAELDFRNE